MQLPFVALFIMIKKEIDDGVSRGFVKNAFGGDSTLQQA
jgi:hypothetical protein